MLPSLLLQLFPFKVNETVVIVNKNEQKLADEIEAALEKLSKDGTLKKISEKWYHRDLFDQLKKIMTAEGDFSETYFSTIIPYNNVIK